jgi:hypothetical protein
MNLANSSQINVIATRSMYLIRELSLTFSLIWLGTLKQVCWHAPAPFAFKDQMIRSSAIHIAYRILAAFFIVMGA